MDKKDIYEHLANIYLDASQKKRKKNKQPPKAFKYLFATSIVLSIGLMLLLASNLNRTKRLNSETSLILLSEAAKINFNFDPAKKETYAIYLKRLDLSRYKILGFSLRKTGYKDRISLRVEFTSAYREKSEVYVKDVPNRWQDYKISLSDFKNISDWSMVAMLSFIVEEWNAKEKKDVIYIDNIRLLR